MYPKQTKNRMQITVFRCQQLPQKGKNHNFIYHHTQNNIESEITTNKKTQPMPTITKSTRSPQMHHQRQPHLALPKSQTQVPPPCQA